MKILFCLMGGAGCILDLLLIGCSVDHLAMAARFYDRQNNDSALFQAELVTNSKTDWSDRQKAISYYICGMIFKKQGNLEQALYAFDKAISLEYFFLDSYWQCAECYKLQGQPALAQKEYQKLQNMAVELKKQLSLSKQESFAIFADPHWQYIIKQNLVPNFYSEYSRNNDYGKAKLIERIDFLLNEVSQAGE